MDINDTVPPKTTDPDQLRRAAEDSNAVGLDPLTILTLTKTIFDIVRTIRGLFGPKSVADNRGPVGDVGGTDVADIIAGITALERILAARVSNPKIAAVLGALVALNGQPWFLDFVESLANRLGTNPTEEQVKALLAPYAHALGSIPAPGSAPPA